MKLEFPGAVPETPVGDLGAAAAYYENNLGLTVDVQQQDFIRILFTKTHSLSLQNSDS